MSWFRYGVDFFGQKYMTVSILEDDEREAVEKEIGRGDFEKLAIFAGDVNDFEFLSKWLPGGPRRLSIQYEIESFAGLEKLTNLVDFHSDTGSKELYPDFGKLMGLERCWLSWDKRYNSKSFAHGLFTLPELKDLTLRYWSKPDCVEIGNLKKLEQLDLRQGSLASIEGLSACAGLKKLHLSHLPKLVDIGALDDLKNLEDIHLESCQNIEDFSPLTRLENVRHIHLEKVNAQFQDLNWLSNMAHVEKICLACEVLNIDWQALFSHPTLRDVTIRSHDGYSVSDAEILDISKTSKRKVKNFKRVGTKKKPSFWFDLE